MSEINWNDAPEDAERYLERFNVFLCMLNDEVHYANTNGGWDEGSSQKISLRHWDDATPRPVETVESTLSERGKRYGEFEDGAKIMQSLKTVMRETEGWSRLTPSQREGLEMIQHKIGRVLNGDSNYDDNYRDIAGYATLLLEECKK